jgi:hypothetical protein
MISMIEKRRLIFVDLKPIKNDVRPYHMRNQIFYFQNGILNILLILFKGKYGVICIEDVIHELVTVGKHFKQVSNFLWPFKLNNPNGIIN